MNKKLFLLLAALLAVGQNAFAYDFSYTYQGKTLFYTIQWNGVSVVNPVSIYYSSYVTGDVVIPDSVENNGTKYAVTSISDNAFYNCSSLTSVTIGTPVTSIGSGAFRGCSGLSTIVVETGNTHYDSRNNCNAIIQTDLNLLIQGCNNTVIPNTVTAIGGGAFLGSGLISMIIPNSVTSIGNQAFAGCTSLTSVTIPNSVTSIGQEAFRGCSGLTSIVVEAGNTHYDSRDNCNAIIQTDLNLLIQGCSSTVIPNTVTAIGTSAFSGCSGLTSVTIPNSVTSIGQQAFYYCSGLTSVTIPNSVTSIGVGAFSGCSGLTSVTIPSSVTSIGWGAFFECNSLTSVTIPNSVTSIGSQTFYACTGLTSVTIPNSVTSIGNYAFNGCSGLTSVTIPNSVTSIGGWAFDGCSGLTSVYCEATTPPTLGSYVFNYYYPIYVPCGSVSAYQNATNWSDYASLIQGMAYMDYSYSFVSNNETMGTVSVGDVDCDSNLTVTATANSGYQFTGWSDGGTGNPRTFHLTGDTSVIAYFEANRYTVIVITDNNTMGTVSDGGTYDYGDTILIEAFPAEHYHFMHWNDGNRDNPRLYRVENDITLTAFFAIDTHTVHVVSNDIVRGMVESTGTQFAYGTPCTVTATAYTGYVFTGWSNGITANPYTFAVTGDVELTALFEEEGTQAITDIDAADITVYAIEGRIIVRGAEGMEVSIFDVMGREVIRSTRLNETPILPNGIYLIKIASLPARKIIVVR